MTCAFATVLTHLFFLSKTYLEYDRSLVCCSSLLISSKALYEKVKPGDLLCEYWKHSKGKTAPPISDEQKKEILASIFKIECTILRVVDFRLEERNLYWQDYTHRFTKMLYPPEQIGQGKFENLIKTANAICNDSFSTYLPLILPIQTVALAAVLMSAAKFKEHLPSQHDSHFEYDMAFFFH